MTEGPLRFRDLFLFQIGHAAAIRRVVASRWSLVIGVLLVFTAGIARNYDQSFLLHQGGRLAGPYIAAIISAFLVFIAVYYFSSTRQPEQAEQPGFYHQFSGFFGGFLMTAPLAWIYAIPVEITTDSLLVAAQWNVAFLSLVSLWRIWLITRVAQVITGAPFTRLLLAILIPASAEAYVGSFFAGFGLAGAMGGILPPDKQFTMDALDVIFTVAAGVFWISVVGCVVINSAGWRRKEGWKGSFSGTWANPPRATLVGAILVTLIWTAAVFPLQSRLGNRETLADLTRHEQYDEAIGWLRSKGPAAFPSARPLYHDPRYVRPQSLVQMFDRIEKEDPPWIAREYLKVSELVLVQEFTGYRGIYREESRTLVERMAALPGGRDTLQSVVETVSTRQRSLADSMPSEERKLLAGDLEKAGVSVPPTWLSSEPRQPPASIEKAP